MAIISEMRQWTSPFVRPECPNQSTQHSEPEGLQQSQCQCPSVSRRVCATYGTNAYLIAHLRKPPCSRIPAQHPSPHTKANKKQTASKRRANSRQATAARRARSRPRASENFWAGVAQGMGRCRCSAEMSCKRAFRVSWLQVSL